MCLYALQARQRRLSHSHLSRACGGRRIASSAMNRSAAGLISVAACLFALLITPSSVGAASLRGLWHNLWAPPAAPALGFDTYGDCSPQQVLLALGSDISELRLTWKTAGSSCLSEVIVQRLSDAGSDSTPQQQQQQEPLTLGMDNTASSVGFSYMLSERDMCDDPAASNPFAWNLHRATLKDLVPGASYRYRIEGGSRHWHFRAPPALSPDAEPFTFLGFGDMGDAVHPAAKSPGAASTLLRLRQEVEASSRPAELMLHAGDLAYAGGKPEIWDSFIEGLQPFAGSMPYMVGVGNWEYGYTARHHSQALTDPSGAAEPYHPSWGNFGPDSRGECGAVAARRFHMPNRYRNRRNNAPFWYSFDYGNVHFTVISTEHALTPGSRQYEWLAEELSAVDRCITPWLVVMLHRPLYVIYPHKSNREVGEHIRAQIEPLLLRHKVDMTLSGHVHSYYRTCAVQDEQCVDDEMGSLRTFAVPRATATTGNTTTTAAATAHEAGGRSRSVHKSGGGVTSPSASAGAAAPGSQQQQQANSRRHGIVHFVIGSAGRKLSDVERDQSDWCAEAVKRWGYGRFTVRGARSLLAEYVSSESGEVLDAVELRASDALRGAVCSQDQKQQQQAAVAVS